MLLFCFSILILLNSFVHVSALFASGNVINKEKTPHVSILGDPGLKFKPYGPRIMLEGWNFCNRAGPAFEGDPILPSPRYADCIVDNNHHNGNMNNNSHNCTFGPYQDNCVSLKLNNLT